MADSDQKKLQSLSDTYQKLQTDLQSTIEARQKLESQQQENTRVQEEFTSPSPAKSGTVYKSIGPVLLKQDRGEAKLAVDARLKFIDQEINRVEKQIQSTQEKSESTKMELYRLQTQLQQGQ